MTPELQAVVERLEETETQVSHLASLVVAQSDADRTVEARMFIVRGADGQPRAELSARGEETAFCLFHADGKLGMEISIRDQGPRLVFWDANGKRRATLETLSTPGGPWLGLFDANGNVRACLGASEGGGRWTEGPYAPKEGPWLEFYDAKQKSVVNVTAGEHGPRIGLFYGNRKRGLDLALSEGGPEIALFDANGKPSVVVQAPEVGGPGTGEGAWLGMYDREGKLRLDARVHDEYGPRLFLRDKATSVFWSAPPTSPLDPMQQKTNAKGDSASMSKSWISRAFDRAIEWAFLSSVKFFIMFAFLAVPVLALLFLVGSAESLAHDWLGTSKGMSDRFLDMSLFAGMVLSLLLCVAIRVGAFDRLFQKEK